MTTADGFPPTGSPASSPPVMSRRERREREEAEARAAAQSAEALAQATESSPAPTGTPLGNVGPYPGEIPSSVAPPTPPAPPPPPPPPPAPPAPPAESGPVLTRRQRREMEEQALRETGTIPTSPPTPEPSPPVNVVAPPAPTPETLLPPAPREPHPEPPPTPPTIQAPAPVPETVLPAAPQERYVEPPAPSPPPLPPVFSAPTPAPSLAPTPETVTSPQVSTETGSFPLAPSEIPDVDAALASSREVSAGSPTTHALILPTTPEVDIAGPIGDTGEILVTGQIPLPRLVAERGVQRELDQDDDDSFDHLIQAETTPLTAPVRATRAVSTREQAQEFHMVRRAPLGSTAALLGISAALLVVAAGGLVAVAVLSGLLAWPF